MKKYVLVGIFILCLFLVSCSLTGNAVASCHLEPYLYKITDPSAKVTVTSSCSKYKDFSQTVCTNRAWLTGQCIKTDKIEHKECIEKTVRCSISVKNYENEVGLFGFKSYFNTQNGRIDKDVQWKDIYPSETEEFAWTYVTTPNEQSISCGIKADSIPKKRECQN